MRKHLTLLALMATFCLPSRADGLNYLTASYNSTEKSIELASVQKITFTESNVVVTTSAGEETFPISEMEKLYFSATATAVENLACSTANLTFQDGVIHAQGNGLLRIYNVNGQIQRMASVSGSATITTHTLPRGLYIIQLGNDVIKIQK